MGFFRPDDELHVLIMIKVKTPRLSMDEEIQFRIKKVRNIAFLFQNSSQSEHLITNILPTWFPENFSKKSGLKVNKATRKSVSNRKLFFFHSQSSYKYNTFFRNWIPAFRCQIHKIEKTREILFP